MAADFVSFASLRNQLRDATFDTPPAIVCNAHITGLAVARALNAHDIPVIAVDRTGSGVASGSTAVEYAGQVTFPLDDPDGVKTGIESLAAELEHDPITTGVYSPTDPAPTYQVVTNEFTGTDYYCAC